MNSVISNNLTLKYQRCTSLDCKDLEIRKFEFVAKTYFPSFEQLYSSILSSWRFCIVCIKLIMVFVYTRKLLIAKRWTKTKD